MSRLLSPMVLMLLVISAMALLNVINIPRGPLLDCYNNVTTYTVRPASYGFPFVFIRGNTGGHECNLISGKISDQTYRVEPYNDYHVERRALVLNGGVAILLAGAAYLVGNRSQQTKTITLKKTASLKTARRHA